MGLPGAEMIVLDTGSLLLAILLVMVLGATLPCRLSSTIIIQPHLWLLQPPTSPC